MSDLPPGLTLDSSDVPRGLTLDTPSSNTSYDHDKLAKLWVRAGGDSKDADLMAHVAMSESSGNPNASNSYTQNGKTYHPTGLWQISDINGPGNYTDPLENARKAVAMHKQSGMSPWLDSKDKGGDGGWGRYLSQKQVAPQAPKPNPLADIMHGLNMPIVGTAGAAENVPPGLKVDAPVTQAPDPTHYSALDQVFAIPDIPFIANSADQRAHVEGPKAYVAAAKMFMHNPAAANAEYGFMAKPELEYEQKHNVGGVTQIIPGMDKVNQNANDYFLKHPKVSGGIAGAAEFVNPGQALLGGPIGAGLKYIRATKAGDKLISVYQNMTSPLKGFNEAGGKQGTNAMMALLTRVASAPAHAQSMALQIFGHGLSKAEQEDVVHVFQGEVSAVATRDPHRFAEIQKRATLLRDYTDQLTGKQVAAGTLKEGTAEANPDHFGMSGAYNDPHLTPNQQKSLDRSRLVRGGGTVTREGSEGAQAKYKTLRSAQTDANAPLRDDFNVVNQFESNAAHALRNASFEDAAKKLPEGLVRPNAEYKPGHPPQDGAGNDMFHFKDLERTNPELAKFIEFSPTLNNAYISPALKTWLEKNSTRLYHEAPLSEGIENKGLRLAAKAWEGFNNGTRQAIVTNPLFHVAWNLTNNAAAAKLPVSQIASLVTKNVFSTIGGGKLVDRFEKTIGQDYSKGVEEAMKAGAIADMKSGTQDATRRMASNFSDLDTTGKIGKVRDSIQAWNNRSTFGKRGEAAFSVALFNHLMKSGKYEATEAGQLVRQALGNYQNVAKDAWQNQVIFFYPWLKGGIEFWAKKALSGAARAPQRAARVNNQLVNDPNEQGQGRAGDYQFTEGNKQDGFRRGSLPVPQKILPEMLDIAGTPFDPAKGGKAALKVVSGRAQPAIGTALDGIITTAQGAKDPAQPQNYHTIFDKNAPPDVQHRQMAAYAASKAPIPVFGYQVKDAIRTGQMPNIPQALISGVTGVQTHEETSTQEYKKEWRIRGQFERLVSHAKKSKDPAVQQAKIAKAYAVYEKRMAKLNPKKKPATAGPPPGLTLDAVPSGLTLDK